MNLELWYEFSNFGMNLESLSAKVGSTFRRSSVSNRQVVENMQRRITSVTALFVTLALCSLTILSFQRATPPAQPSTGPGSKQYAHTGVRKNRYGTGNQEYWIFEPEAPRPATAPLVVFLH